jgi:hypothetical protein
MAIATDHLHAHKSRHVRTMSKGICCANALDSSSGPADGFRASVLWRRVVGTGRPLSCRHESLRAHGRKIANNSQATAPKHARVSDSPKGKFFLADRSQRSNAAIMHRPVRRTKPVLGYSKDGGKNS